MSIIRTTTKSGNTTLVRENGRLIQKKEKNSLGDVTTYNYHKDGSLGISKKLHNGTTIKIK